jgi:signal transduction histidine kinase
VEISTGKVKIGEDELIIAIVRDITERKEIEKSLAENAVRQESLLKASKTLASSLELEKAQQKAVDIATDLLSLEKGMMYEVEDEALILRSASHEIPEDFPEENRRLSLEDHPHIRKALDKKEIIFLKDLENENFTEAEKKLAVSGESKSILLIPVIGKKQNNAVLVLGSSDQERTFSLEEIDVYKTLAKQIALALENARHYHLVKKQADELEEKVVRRTAKLDEANKELETFTYSVSHDLRAPLRAINSFTRYMETDFADKLDSEAKRHIQAIKDNTFKMDQLMRDLLKLSRLSRTEPEMIDLDMTSIARSMYYEMATELEKEEFELELGELPHAKGDISMIRQLWSNIIGNSLKFSSLSDIKKIEIGAKEEEDKIIYFVRDHGEGFDPIYKEKLFGIFQRFHKGDDFPGTGVGLTLVKRVLDRHNGSIWAEGEPDKGAIFYFALPKISEN